MSRYTNNTFTFDFSGFGTFTVTFQDGFYNYDQIVEKIVADVLAGTGANLVLTQNHNNGRLTIESNVQFKIVQSGFLSLLGLDAVSTFQGSVTGSVSVDLIKVKYFIVVCSITGFNTIDSKNLQFQHFVPVTSLNFGDIGNIPTQSDNFNLCNDPAINSIFLEFYEEDTTTAIDWHGKYPIIEFEITD